jgi:hypothetical protein
MGRQNFVVILRVSHPPLGQMTLTFWIEQVTIPWEHVSPMTLDDIVNRIDSAFPFFAFGDRQADEKLENFSRDQEGTKQRWDWYRCLSENILEFLSKAFPNQRKEWYQAILDYRMSTIKEKIIRIEKRNELELYLNRIASEAK